MVMKASLHPDDENLEKKRRESLGIFQKNFFIEYFKYQFQAVQTISFKEVLNKGHCTSPMTIFVC
jgi:hypothetical protein